MPSTLKRGTRIEYTYAAGKVVRGTVLKPYGARDIALHARTHGEKAAAELPNWYPCQLEDEHGTYRGACHVSQLRVVDNRAAVA